MTPRLSLKTDDVHFGDKLQQFRVRVAREQSFTVNVEAHNVAEAECVAENFCARICEDRWAELTENVHKTFEAEPEGNGTGGGR